jgi:hypothetical protein
VIKFSSLFALLLAGLTSPARAAFVPENVPSIAPLSSFSAALPPIVQSLPTTLNFPALSLPSPSIPVSAPKILPGVWNHLPLEMPAEAAIPVPAHDEYHLPTGFMETSDVLVASPGKYARKPAAPSAPAAIEFAVIATKASGDALFDRAAAHAVLPAR